MACAKPVVATKCGGPQEIVSNISGYLCEADSEDLANKMNQMIESRSSFNSGKIREDVLNRFSPSKWAIQIEELFKSLISDP